MKTKTYKHYKRALNAVSAVSSVFVNDRKQKFCSTGSILPKQELDRFEFSGRVFVLFVTNSGDYATRWFGAGFGDDQKEADRIFETETEARNNFEDIRARYASSSTWNPSL